MLGKCAYLWCVEASVANSRYCTPHGAYAKCAWCGEESDMGIDGHQYCAGCITQGAVRMHKQRLEQQQKKRRVWAAVRELWTSLRKL